MAQTQAQPDAKKEQHLLSLLRPAQRGVIEARRSVCEPCSQNQGLGVVSVKCEACGCAGVSLIHGQCKLRKWPRASRDLPGAWLLTYPGAGASHLIDLLTDNGISTAQLEGYRLAGPRVLRAVPQNNLAHPAQMAWQQRTLDGVLAEYPDTRLLRIRRHDLVATAVSMYLAELASAYRGASEPDLRASMATGRVPIDKRWLMACYEYARSSDAYWESELKRLGVDAREVWYEDLVSDPKGTLVAALEYLGVSWTAESLASRPPKPDDTPGAGRAAELLHEQLEVMLGQTPTVNDDTGERREGRGGLNPSRLIVGALSCSKPEYQARRERCRNTWLPELEAAGTEVLFLVGVGDQNDGPRLVPPDEHGRVGWELQIPCPDTYEALPQKTAAFCRWACEYRAFDYLFKCDDDTYISTERLFEIELGCSDDYVGESMKFATQFAHGGAGYFLSHRAARLMAGQMKAKRGLEDLIVSRHLANVGILLRADERFVSQGTDERRPKPGNSFITSHAFDRPWDEHVPRGE